MSSIQFLPALIVIGVVAITNPPLAITVIISLTNSGSI